MSEELPVPALARRATAEALGTALLLAAVVGSGIMGERLAGGNVAVTLLANTIATGAALFALILTFGPVSGAHFNPAVTARPRSAREWSGRVAPFDESMSKSTPLARLRSRRRAAAQRPGGSRCVTCS